MFRSLIYFWPMHLVIILGAAVTTAVLTGALLVGDSVRGSLRDLTLDSLGQIDYVLAAEKFFGEDVVEDLKALPLFDQYFSLVAPSIFLNGGATSGSFLSRATQVSIHGIDDRFLQFFETDRNPVNMSFDSKNSGIVFPSVVINRALQKELNAKVGDSILLTLRRPNDIHPEFMFGNSDPSETSMALRVSIVQVIADEGIGRFGLRIHQSYPKNAFLSLSVLQEALARKDEINGLLVSQAGESTRGGTKEILQKFLQQAFRLEDFNLRLRLGLDYFSLESSELIIPPVVEEKASIVAKELKLSFQPILTYLANNIRVRGREIPYSTVTAVDFSVLQAEELEFIVGGSPPILKSDSILLNEWAASDLKAQIGDVVELSYYVLGTGDKLLTENSQFKLTGVVAMKGLALDRDLIPDIPGIQGVDSIFSWDPPVPINLDRIRPRDEAYWDQYGPTPKAFVVFERGEVLWSSRFGRVSSIRFSNIRDRDLGEMKARFEKILLERLDPSTWGLEFRSVKQQRLMASSGATDFGMLFLAFSFFLIVSAVLLSGLLFRLSVEQRAREIGLLLSLGYSVNVIRKRFLIEGGVIAAFGSFLGLVGSIGYAVLLIVGLENWWNSAVGMPFLSLHIHTSSLVIGLLISWLIVFVSIGWGVRRLAGIPIPLLSQGMSWNPKKVRPNRWPGFLAFSSLGISIVLLLIFFMVQEISSLGLFFSIGIFLLLSGLAFFSLWLRRNSQNSLTFHSLGLMADMAFRNSTRNPGRSLLSVALVSVACFVIVTVGATRHEPGEELLRRDSGAGGFSWLARSDIPVLQDLNDVDQRFELGFSKTDSTQMSDLQIVSFRMLPGEDISCLNLYQPQNPRILGVPNEQIQRGGFRFQQLVKTLDNPWDLLTWDLGADTIPAFGDANSVQWILHSGLGDYLKLQNEKGEPIRLQLVGLLDTSIFQGELLISENNLLRHFPGRVGYQFFLIDSSSGEEIKVDSLLERNLRRFGMDATSTIDVLADYLAVENTYLSTFQTLGGLGLLLGTLGLGVILVRNVLERRRELATLRVFGFRRSQLAWMVLVENGFLLFLGLMLGALSALIAAMPHLIGKSAPFPWWSLTITLGIVFLVGMLVGVVAVSVMVRLPLLPSLKKE